DRGGASQARAGLRDELAMELVAGALGALGNPGARRAVTGGRSPLTGSQDQGGDSRVVCVPPVGICSTRTPKRSPSLSSSAKRKLPRKATRLRAYVGRERRNTSTPSDVRRTNTESRIRPMLSAVVVLTAT